ncbi:DUF397 domain-containing protein [Streptomyces sp. HUAS MG47]|uniref:DUF397 domain-containing protein n=1 Tax=Streptomyces solicamelliae TaxID=3231716 RepID=UPI0038780CC0
MKIENTECELSTALWFRSSFSDATGGDCVEVATWRKSSYSAGDGSNCLEISEDHPGLVPVRDSKNPDGPKLVFRADAWAAFIGGVRVGR